MVISATLIVPQKRSLTSKKRALSCLRRTDSQKFSSKVGTIFGILQLASTVAPCRLATRELQEWHLQLHELSRSIGVTQKTAWFILHRIREAMHTDNFIKLGGKGGAAIEVDEAYIGGKAKNMHASRRREIQAGLHGDHKTPVVRMLDSDTRQVRATVVPNVKREVLLNQILDNINREATILHR